MVTFTIGMILLIVGGTVYGRYCQSVFDPDDRKTPATECFDGVDFVPMSKRKNSLIELLNIAGTGPILGPIQGILFGPIAFLLIPIGNVLGGAMHDYFSAMISMRSGGAQMPELIKNHLGERVYKIYNIFVALALLLVAAVFIYTPGDLIVTGLLGQSASADNPSVFIVYAIIFVYYLLATLMPIDKLIGKIYPFFGAILLLSSLGIGFGLFFHSYPLTELSFSSLLGTHPDGLPLIPVFFITIACGIVSGFHATQTTMLARSVESEHQGRRVFYDMMILEGVIAMIWAAAAMGVYNSFLVTGAQVGSPEVIGVVAKDMMGSIGGTIAIIGVIVLPITTGDTAFRSLRLIAADFLKINQKSKLNRLMISSFIFSVAAFVLFYAKTSSQGFNLLWRYFAWTNQTIAVFAFALITVYLKKQGKNYFIALLPGMFYCFIVTSYIFSVRFGANLSADISYILAAASTILFGYVIVKK